MDKKISFLGILIIAAVLFSGCYDRTEIEDQTYVIAMGFDKGVVEPLRLTLQYAVPKSISSSSGGGGGGDGGGKNMSSITLECPTLYAGLDMANGFIGKRVNLSHAVVAVFSEELAREEGISIYLYAMARNKQNRPNVYIAVSKCPAEEYLKSINPQQEIDPSKYYELLYSAFKYTGFTPNSVFYRIYDKMTSIGWQTVAALADVSQFKSTSQFKNTSKSYKEKGRDIPYEGDFKAGELLKVGDQNGEIMGMAVFKGDKMVGEMDGEDATDRLFITGEFKEADFSIPDPVIKKDKIVLNIKQSRKPVIKVDLNGDQPKISVKIQLEADIESIQSGYFYEFPNKLQLIETTAGDFLQQEVVNFLNRTANKYECDICGFGRYAGMKFLTYKEWKDYDWVDKYKNSSFDVNIDLKIRRPGLMIMTPPIIRGSEDDSSQ